jgi:hypothetical protein
VLVCLAGTEQYIPVVTSGDFDEILYADTKRCPHLKVLMQASEAMLKGGSGANIKGSQRGVWGFEEIRGDNSGCRGLGTCPCVWCVCVWGGVEVEWVDECGVCVERAVQPAGSPLSVRPV